MTTAVLTLADFVLARLREDERTAKRCWVTEQPWIGFVDHRGSHYVGLSCARVRTDVRAKREIVRLHADCDSRSDHCDSCGRGRPEGSGCTTLAYLALPYASHRDYQPEWRP